MGPVCVPGGRTGRPPDSGHYKTQQAPMAELQRRPWLRRQKHPQAGNAHKVKDGLEEHQRGHRGQALSGHVCVFRTASPMTGPSVMERLRLTYARSAPFPGSTLLSPQGRSRIGASRTSSPWALSPSRQTTPPRASATSASALRTSTTPTSSSTFLSRAASSTMPLVRVASCLCTASKACLAAPLS